MTNSEQPEPGKKLIRNSTVQFLVFTAENDLSGIEARYEDETVWLSQRVMSELFEVDVRTVNEHLRNIFESGELGREATIRNFRIVQIEGERQVTRSIEHYNLDAIISVGYRVNSVRATQFRQWATSVLREFAVKGFVLDRDRLENGSYLGEDYFEELLEQIREIRLSERRFYQKVTDIYATSVDYNADAGLTKQFFATVQNKLHFAVHGHTSAELIAKRADAAAPNMGLTAWKNGPEGKILRSDVTVGKNYLSGDELRDMSGLVSAYLELAENRARRRIPMTMQDWANQLDGLLKLDDREVLDSAGTISQGRAQSLAVEQYEQFRVSQDRKYMSDFDKFAAEIEQEK